MAAFLTYYKESVLKEVEREVLPMTEAEHRLLGRLRSMARGIAAEHHVSAHGHFPSPSTFPPPPRPKVNPLVEALRDIIDERVAAALASKK